MAIKLRQSTASQEVPLGIFVDSVDGNSEESGLTIANTDVKLWKTGATTLASKNSGGATYISNGVYYCVLDATDTDTAGPMVAFIHVAGALAVRVEFEVLPALLYDSLVAGSDNLQVDVTQLLGTAWLTPGTAGTPDVNAKLVGGTAQAAGDLATLTTAVKTKTDYLPSATAGTAGGLALHFAGKVSGSVNDAAATTTSFIGDSGLSATNDLYNGCWLVPTSGTLIGIPRRISDYVGATKTFTFNTAFPAALANGVTFLILGRAE